MTGSTAYETTWLGVLEELRTCPDVRLREAHQGDIATGDADQAFAELAERDGVVLDPSLKRYYLRFSGLAAVWDVADPEFEDESLIAGGVRPVQPAPGDPVGPARGTLVRPHR